MGNLEPGYGSRHRTILGANHRDRSRRQANGLGRLRLTDCRAAIDVLYRNAENDRVVASVPTLHPPHTYSPYNGKITPAIQPSVYRPVPLA
jgi:hypothetical protein